MKKVYPVIFKPVEDGHVATVPDFDRATQGDTIAEAIEMARDLICLMGVAYEDNGQPIPDPSQIDTIKTEAGEIVSLVDADFLAYRAFLDNRSVRKNCTLPSWLNAKAEKADVNFSQVLQEALIDRLGLSGRKGA